MYFVVATKKLSRVAGSDFLDSRELNRIVTYLCVIVAVGESVAGGMGLPRSLR